MTPVCVACGARELPAGAWHITLCAMCLARLELQADSTEAALAGEAAALEEAARLQDVINALAASLTEERDEARKKHRGLLRLSRTEEAAEQNGLAEAFNNVLFFLEDKGAIPRR